MERARVTHRITKRARLCIRALFFCALAAACGVASAQTEAQLSLGLMDFTYKEWADSGVLLDREDALLPGVVFELAHRSGPWRISGSGSFFRGDADYGGQTQGGVGASANTNEQLWSAALRLERRFDIGSWWVSPYVGLAYHEWQRDIKNGRTVNNTPVSGLLEVYSWKTAELGALARLGSLGRLEATLDARYFGILDPQLRASITGADDVNLALGKRDGGRLGLIGAYPLGEKLKLRVEVFYERWAFGKSAPKPLTGGGTTLGTVFEPRSDTQTTGILAGVVYSF